MTERQEYLNQLIDLYQALKNGDIINDDGISMFDLAFEINCIQIQIDRSNTGE